MSTELISNDEIRTAVDEQLADLHGRGVLTDKKFASAKARMLAGD